MKLKVLRVAPGQLQQRAYTLQCIISVAHWSPVLMDHSEVHFEKKDLNSLQLQNIKVQRPHSMDL